LIDERGTFRQWFEYEKILTETGIDFTVAQANLSESKKAVVRGIHYSMSTKGQAKLVTCATGEIKDFVIDIRPNSETYGKFTSVNLKGGDGQAVLIASGLGHGFVSIADSSVVSYLVTSPYSPNEEFTINPIDPEIGIDWGVPIGELNMSQRDREAKSLRECLTAGHLPNNINV
jgi:dTDP-4-dehydrorhamnose 3,5-epimerase